MICPCGKRIENTSASPYQVRTFDNEGNVIFAICVHGHVVINELQEEEKNEELRFFGLS